MNTYSIKTHFLRQLVDKINVSSSFDKKENIPDLLIVLSTIFQAGNNPIKLFFTSLSSSRHNKLECFVYAEHV
jgi:hypothetical protein